MLGEPQKLTEALTYCETSFLTAHYYGLKTLLTGRFLELDIHFRLLLDVVVFLSPCNCKL
jgi:hypothetical protein